MAFVQTFPSEAATPIGSRVNIVCVPAIGADPRVTWSTDPPDHHGVLQQLHRLLPLADIVLYDHLTPDERGIEVKAQKDAGHKSTAVAFAVAEERVARYGIQEWADRFLRAFWKQFQSNESIRGNLQLKWQMSEKLRQSLSLASEELRILNYNFAKAAIGIRIFSYIETRETELNVLSSSDASGEFLTRVHVCIVAERSAILNTAECSVEEEEVVGLNLKHTAFPRFQEEAFLCTNFAEKMAAFVRSLDAEERAAHAALVSSIVDGIRVDVHQFYEIGEQEATASMKVWSAQPSLRDFWKYGPDACLKQRLKKPETSHNPPLASIRRPRLEISPASEPIAPTITVAPALTTSVRKEEQTASDAPTEKPLPHISNPDPPLHIIEPSDRTGSLKPTGTATKSTLTHSPYNYPGGLLGPQDLPPSKSASSRQGFEKVQPPQRSHTYQLPSISSDRFRWVHVPCTHAGWVPHTLTSISQEQDKLDLHAKFLHDQLWSSQHNRSRHASHHAQFVRPSIRCLLPEGSHARHPQGIMTPLSACNGIQLVLYLPYLHWDSFEQLRVRATTIKRRMRQENARPADHDIAMGQSLETKLIWQYLRSERPLHCRRTLDQYGYPSLRNTAVRDSDQILYKRTRADKDAEPPPLAMPKRPSHMDQLSVESDPLQDKPRDNEAKVLMVDQLWLWIVDEQTVVTFATPKEKEDDGGLSDQGDLRENIYKDVNGDYARRCSDPFDFAALVVFTELQTRSFKDFRNNHRLRDPGDIDVRRLPKYVDNRSDLDALLELRDIEDELGTIHKLLKEQHSTVKDMLTYYKSFTAIKSSGAVGKNGILLLQTVDHNIKEYREQVDSMLNSARAAQTAFKELLDMKQKQANIVEAHLAREQTEVAADQSRSVMIFTIFTIIFLPLSFFASVFGINAREWSGESHNLGIHTIFVYMGSISLAVIIVALLVAFNKHTRRLAQRFWQMSAGPVQRMWMKGRERGARKQECEVEKKRLGQEASKPQRFNTLSVLTRQWTRMRWDEEAGIKALD
ncbi:MAG: hypothetical protein Q9200_001989 [Gallowayella weberi]